MVPGTRIDYDYDLISGKVNNVNYQSGNPDAFSHHYRYDAENRLIEVYTSNYSDAHWINQEDDPIWNLDAKYFYYPHGPLARVEMGKQVQDIDYAYTLQGWLKGVNSNTLKHGHDIGNSFNSNPTTNDAFGYSLSYYDGDYSSIGTTSFEASTTGSDLLASRNNLFNGNISAMVSTIKNPSTGDVLPQGMGYKYDQLNRLTESIAYQNLDTEENEWGNGGSSKYENDFSYDANGNILSQVRKDQAGDPMDNLTYRYAANSEDKILQNRLYHVNDDVPGTNYVVDIDNQLNTLGTNSTAFVSDLSTINTDNNYSYDELGNLKKDYSEGIENIDWTISGKIKSIERYATATGDEIEFDYDPSGNRIAKRVYDADHVWKYSVYYVRDAQGNIMANYKSSYDDQLELNSFKLEEQDIYGSSRVGAFKPGLELLDASPPPSLSHVLDYKNYELSNHLGNVLTVVDGRKKPIESTTTTGTIDHYEPDIISTQDYYPFGMLMPERSYRWVYLKGTNYDTDPTDVELTSINGLQDPETIASEFDSYRFGFNGKENDNEAKGVGNQQDYGMRIYDPRIGKFLATDPLQKLYPNLSSYQFSGNMPIAATDKDGLETHIVIYNHNKFGRVMQLSVSSYIDESGRPRDSDLKQGDRDVAGAKQNIMRIHRYPNRPDKIDFSESLNASEQVVFGKAQPKQKPSEHNRSRYSFDGNLGKEFADGSFIGGFKKFSYNPVFEGKLITPGSTIMNFNGSNNYNPSIASLGDELAESLKGLAGALNESGVTSITVNINQVIGTKLSQNQKTEVLSQLNQIAKNIASELKKDGLKESIQVKIGSVKTMESGKNAAEVPGAGVSINTN